MICRECMRNKFDSEGFCENCGTYSYEMADKIKQEEYEAKKKAGDL